MGTDNKSLHPTGSSVTPGAISCHAHAPGAPAAPAGELNRYICRQWPHSTQGRPLHRKPIGQSVAGPSRATCKIMTSAGRPALMPFFMVGCMPPTNYNVQHMPLMELTRNVPSLGKLRQDCRFYSVGQPGWPVIRPHKQPECLQVVAHNIGAGRADYGVSLHRSFTPPAADRAALRKYNKSLHPTVSSVTAVACCPGHAATAAPAAPAGELNRYGHYQVPMIPPYAASLIIAFTFVISNVSCIKKNDKEESSSKSDVHALPSTNILNDKSHINDITTQEIMQFLTSRPNAAQIKDKLSTMKINVMFGPRQNSAYCWDTWKLPDGSSLTIYGHGSTSNATHVELRDPHRQSIFTIKYKSYEEAEEEYKKEAEKRQKERVK